MSNTFSLSDFIIYSIPIGLKISLKSIQYILGSLGTAARLIIEKHGFINRVVVHPIIRSEEHTSELQSRGHLVCRLLLEKKKKKNTKNVNTQDSMRASSAE